MNPVHSGPKIGTHVPSTTAQKHVPAANVSFETYEEDLGADHHDTWWEEPHSQRNLGLKSGGIHSSQSAGLSMR